MFSFILVHLAYFKTLKTKMQMFEIIKDKGIKFILIGYNTFLAKIIRKKCLVYPI